MKANLMYNFSRIIVIPSLIISFSLISYAGSRHDIIPSVQSAHSSGNNKNQLQNIIVTTQQKSEFTYISKKLNEAQLPKELVLIPVIESNYHTGVVSNKGAGGLWQLMPQTAKDYGISSKDRFQVGPSTVAALRYFNQLHRKFGNWEFAIAAYNAGEGRVQKALKKNPSATCVQQLNLPRETKQYVQKFYQMEGELKSYSV